MIERAELESLQRPISADRPCGESLEDSAELSLFSAYRVFGQATSWEQPPEWRDLRAKSLEALARSKDLRLLAYLAAAVLRTDGLVALCQTLGVAADWLDTFWEQVFPSPEDEGIFRRNALSCFTDRIAILDALRRAALVSSRQLGTFSMRDVELAQGILQPTDAGAVVPQPTQIAAAFAGMPAEELSELSTAVAAGLGALQRIEARMRATLGAEGAPDLQPLTSQLQRIDKLLREHRPSAADPQTAGTGGQEIAVGGNLGPIRSRQDAIRVLDAVAQFFRQTEPSSPVPLFVDRAKRLIAKNFLEVLEDIAPDAVAQARKAGGMSDST
jgi:type VI secretion system protein ImpA